LPNSTHSRENLFEKLLKGELSPEETQELIQWLGEENLDNETASLIVAHLKKPVMQNQVSPAMIAALEARLPLIFKEDKPSSRIVRLAGKKWLRYAASILLLLAAGAYFIIPGKKQSGVNEKNVSLASKATDPQPGKEGAILTLTDGTQLVLDSMSNGLITTQNGIKVLLNNGQVTYTPDKKTGEQQIAYNTMTTPRGRQFQLLLPDGSKVWLNAASSIRYPVVFSGNERKVDITGEAYFEVTKNAAMPFRVSAGTGTEIEVLGTHFNINSYSNEGSINTTLLEGSVKVKRQGANDVKLIPGQQARIDRHDKSGASSSAVKVVNDVDVERVMAWKNGVFNFQDATLEEVMRQLERWYDIEVVYEKGIPSFEFYGKMGRDLPLLTVLRGLNLSNVNFRMEEGKKLVVTP
jgi:ferric-dicitrate binding protein FerR (iron transport regulator)